MNAEAPDPSRLTPAEIAALPLGEYAFPGPLRDQLVAAILDGRKTSTSSLLEEWAREGEEPPEAGRLEVVVDSVGRPVCVTRNSRVEVVRLADVSDRHARNEGEGFEGARDWRVAHERFWTGAEYVDAVGEPAIAINDDTLVVCVSFEVVSKV